MTMIIKNWIPKFSWYGSKNQYHVWLFGNTAFTSKEDPNVKYGFFRDTPKKSKSIRHSSFVITTNTSQQ